MRQELTKRFKGLLKAKTPSEALLLQMEGRITKLEAEKDAVTAQAQASHLKSPPCRLELLRYTRDGALSSESACRIEECCLKNSIWARLAWLVPGCIF